MFKQVEEIMGFVRWFCELLQVIYIIFVQIYGFKCMPLYMSLCMRVFHVWALWKRDGVHASLFLCMC